MKLSGQNITFILMALCMSCTAKKEPSVEPTTNDDPIFRIEQMKVMERKVITAWPSEKVALFQGLKKQDQKHYMFTVKEKVQSV